MRQMSRFVRPTLTAAAIIAAASAANSASAQTVIWDNGDFVTAQGIGFNGADISQTESGIVIGLGNNASPPSGNPVVIADDFVVFDGPVNLHSMTWYGFLSGQTTTENPFDTAYVTLWDNDPFFGGQLIAGDFTTNRFVSGEWTGVYRTSSSSSQSAITSNIRPIMALELDMTWAPELPTGAYYVGVTIAVGPGYSGNVFSSPVPQQLGHNASQLFENEWFVTPIDFPFIIRAVDNREPTCVADWDNDGEVTIGDYFAFLNSFFSQLGGSGSADIDGDGEVTIGDYFAFLTAFFAGLQGDC